MLNLAILGCGRIMKKHLAAIQQTGSFKLVAICDKNLKKLAMADADPKVERFSDFKQLLEKGNFDVLSVLTPSGLHKQHTLCALRSGKHVIVEKPMSLSFSDAKKMQAAAQLAERRLFVVKQNRFNLPVMQAHDAVKKGLLGPINYATVRVRWCRDQNYYNQDTWRGSWQFDGGVIANQAAHHVDLLTHFLGRAKSCSAIGKTFGSKIETEDTCLGQIEFTNNVHAMIEATTSIRPKNVEGSLSIIGQNGFIEIGGHAVNKMLHWEINGQKPEQAYSAQESNVSDVYGSGHVSVYSHIAHCLNTQQISNLEWEGVKDTIELIAALYKSMETGHVVKLPLSEEHSLLGDLGRVV
jgi:UDP-N-acetyl-2-amino-2-deoxyglucuronate dehydrogenase